MGSWEVGKLERGEGGKLGGWEVAGYVRVTGNGRGIGRGIPAEKGWLLTCDGWFAMAESMVVARVKRCGEKGRAAGSA